MYCSEGDIQDYGHMTTHQVAETLAHLGQVTETVPPSKDSRMDFIQAVGGLTVSMLEIYPDEVMMYSLEDPDALPNGFLLPTEFQLEDGSPIAMRYRQDPDVEQPEGGMVSVNRFGLTKAFHALTQLELSGAVWQSLILDNVGSLSLNGHLRNGEDIEVARHFMVLERLAQSARRGRDPVDGAYIGLPFNSLWVNISPYGPDVPLLREPVHLDQ